MANDNSSESMGIMRLAMKGSQLTEHKPVSSSKGQPPSSKLHNTRHDTNRINTTLKTSLVLRPSARLPIKKGRSGEYGFKHGGLLEVTV